MFNVNQLYSIPLFWEQIFRKLITTNQHLLPWRIKRKRSLIIQSHFTQWKVDQWLVFAAIRCRNFIFLLNTSEKLLVLAAIRQKISSLRTVIVYKNFIFIQKSTFAERISFLTFSFEGKFKRKDTKSNENMIFSVLFTNFRKPKILFFMQSK